MTVSELKRLLVCLNGDFLVTFEDFNIFVWDNAKVVYTIHNSAYGDIPIPNIFDEEAP